MRVRDSARSVTAFSSFGEEPCPARPDAVSSIQAMPRWAFSIG
ncbi:hypothetical protein SVIOM342S_08934 [Streptomyces violaceorubidus]